MPRLTTDRIPKYRHHRASGQAVVTIDGKDYYLGPYGSKASRVSYDRLIAEWIANGRRSSPDDSSAMTVTELLAAYWRHAKDYYKRDGKFTQQYHIKAAIRPLKKLYGDKPAASIGPLALKAVRQQLMEAGQCRNYVNSNIGWIKHVYKWAVENELVPPSVYHGLQSVAGLRKGRTEARESDPVKPVPEPFVDAVLPHVAPQVAAMIQLQVLTGMRPGEVLILRGCDLDTTGRIWTYVPERHKTEHHGHERVIYLGPQAQMVLKPWLKPDLDAYLFSPAEAEAQRNAKRRQDRKTPLWERRAITRGIDKANKGIDDPNRRIPYWHPHQLRHTAATRLRKEFGIEAARVVLGHRSAAVTESYAEIDRRKAADIMAKVG